uniref:Agglutinin domain-containing protein n=1 Tax=Opuntia streptacantha TaxID=393608 RepID=A0A7C8ZQD7_OPUST
MAALALPSSVCLKSVYNEKYLRYKYDDARTRGLLQFAGETVMDPYAQFEVEKAKTWDGLVHLKSRYTNKYLVRWSPNHYWITASAYNADEDQGSWTCTLFKPILVEESDGTQKLRLLHVQLGHYACLWRIGAPFESCLFAGSKDPDKDSCDVFTIVDWVSIFRFPKRVAFKGEYGLFLGADVYNNQPSLRFAFSDPQDPKVVQQIIPAPDGTIFIKSELNGKFWRRAENDWILADAEDPRGTGKAVGMFRPSVLGTNVVGLLEMERTTFVKRLTAAGVENFLSAGAENIDTDSRLQVIDVDK